MDSGTALRELGVTAGLLTAAERAQLDADGFLPLPGVLSAAQLQVFRDRLAELSAAEGDQAGIEVHQEEGTDRLADLVNKDPVFEVCFTSPRVLAAVAHVLGDFTLSSLNSRAALPGSGHQRLHTDWGEPVPAGDYQVCNSIWLIDDFTSANGPTRVVPGSHRSGQLPGQALADPVGPAPGRSEAARPGRHRGDLQCAPVAWRDAEHHAAAAPGAARLLLPPRPEAAARSAGLPPARNAGPAQPGRPAHPRRLSPA